MNAKVDMTEDETDGYEAPRLDVVALCADEVLAGSCKDITGAGPSMNCQDEFGGSCASLGS